MVRGGGVDSDVTTSEDGGAARGYHRFAVAIVLDILAHHTMDHQPNRRGGERGERGEEGRGERERRGRRRKRGGGLHVTT
jgi:hypothetical protein